MLLDSNKPLWKRRVSVVEAIYRNLIIEDISFKSSDFCVLENWTDFEKSIYDSYMKNKARYLSLINRYLKAGWEVSRINKTTVSILLEALTEFYLLNTPKSVLISQSVKTAKNYCDEEEFKLINGILDNIFTDSTESSNTTDKLIN